MDMESSKDVVIGRKFPFAEDVGETDVITVRPDASLTEAAVLMRDQHVGDLVVSDGREPLGMITDRDITLAFADGDFENLRVTDVMSNTPACGNENDDIFTLIRTMKDCGVGRLPICRDDGRLCGIITAKKLLQVLVKGLIDLASLSKEQQRMEEKRH